MGDDTTTDGGTGDASQDSDSTTQDPGTTDQGSDDSGSTDQSTGDDSGTGDQGDPDLSGDAGQGDTSAADAQQGGGWLDQAKSWLGIGQADQAQPDWTDEVAGHYDDPQPDYTRQYAVNQGSPVEDVNTDEDGDRVSRSIMPDGTVAVHGSNATQNILYPDGRHSVVWSDGDTYESDPNTGMRTHLRPGETSGTSKPMDAYDRRLDQQSYPMSPGEAREQRR